ncbi:serine/threonine-protein kinase ULK3 [Capsaspora owczarzaki ATCC 30864]|uniref:non-specific serine/threonine protein kinase n=1 Tax=Capsaspora owczarzaki (strain ATCC 30864) TaxID=595528 RepID=A0A0D2X3C6_CAPO3|nr:serine/threonine-protein kinase ULK3 [Capsaspora owczarzaki ATCC 30864]KJE94074.1 ULK/ULK protein kinase [Capsaspora owczarzaki ATCC 30864]|eukprot:XP_004347520.2 serine/threonine-protein kinase ULK3 [Capsaspora owczarzaki ATCC 30864]
MRIFRRFERGTFSHQHSALRIAWQLHFVIRAIVLPAHLLTLCACLLTSERLARSPLSYKNRLSLLELSNTHILKLAQKASRIHTATSQMALQRHTRPGDPAAPTGSDAEAALKIVGRYVYHPQTDRIGRGSFATVYRARYADAPGYVAIKRIKKQKLSARLNENLDREVDILRLVKHPHIVQLYEIQASKENVYLIMEYCDGGDLSQFIRKKKLLPEELVRSYTQQIASALEALRMFNIVHRDLKPQNLMLVKRETVIKIADFGFARYLQTDTMAETLCGSPLYMAPEILESKQYDAKGDLWSVGVILYECLVGHAPFRADNYLELLRTIKTSKDRIPLPPNASIECRDVIAGLMCVDPERRIGFDDFFAHPFVALQQYKTRLRTLDPGFAKQDEEQRQLAVAKHLASASPVPADASASQRLQATQATRRPSHPTDVVDPIIAASDARQEGRPRAATHSGGDTRTHLAQAQAQAERPAQPIAQTGKSQAVQILSAVQRAATAAAATAAAAVINRVTSSPNLAANPARSTPSRGSVSRPPRAETPPGVSSLDEFTFTDGTPADNGRSPADSGQFVESQPVSRPNSAMNAFTAAPALVSTKPQPQTVQGLAGSVEDYVLVGPSQQVSVNAFADAVARNKVPSSRFVPPSTTTTTTTTTATTTTTTASSGMPVPQKSGASVAMNQAMTDDLRQHSPGTDANRGEQAEPDEEDERTLQTASPTLGERFGEHRDNSFASRVPLTNPATNFRERAKTYAFGTSPSRGSTPHTPPADEDRAVQLALATSPTNNTTPHSPTLMGTSRVILNKFADLFYSSSASSNVQPVTDAYLLGTSPSRRAMSSSSRSFDENVLFSRIESAAQHAFAVQRLAKILNSGQQSTGPLNDDGTQALLLYMRALEFYFEGINLSRQLVRNNASIPSDVNSMIQLLRSKINDCIDSVDSLRSRVPPNAPLSFDLSVEKVIYENSIMLAREAAVRELLGHFQDAQEAYWCAYFLLESLLMDRGETPLEESDKALVKRYSASVSKRIHILQQRLSTSNGSQPISLSSSVAAGSPTHQQNALAAQLTAFTTGNSLYQHGGQLFGVSPE